jgi:hypothetical protein
VPKVGLNGVIASFLNEAALEKSKTLDQLNNWFQIWLRECHQTKLHAALGEATSPEMAYRSDTKNLRFVEAKTLANAFLHSEDRKVDKTGCVNFMGKKYEVGLLFMGMKVQVVYDPADITEVTIEIQGHPTCKARELVIGERTGKRPTLPKHLLPEVPSTSRLLRGAEQQHEKRQARQAPAVSYRTVRKEDGEHV